MNEQLKQHRETILAERGVVVTYMQREIVIKDMPAVPSKSRYLHEKSGDRMMQSVDRQYTVEFGLLKWEDKQVIPKAGDIIIEGENAYEVVPDEFKQCYRPIDPDSMYVRIFVQKTTRSQ
jgi:hypothetical protein